MGPATGPENNEGGEGENKKRNVFQGTPFVEVCLYISIFVSKSQA
jgi:hypothetical protein